MSNIAKCIFSKLDMSQLIPSTKGLFFAASMVVLLIEAYPHLSESYPLKAVVDLGRWFFPRIVKINKNKSLVKTFVSLIILNVAFQVLLDVVSSRISLRPLSVCSSPRDGLCGGGEGRDDYYVGPPSPYRRRRRQRLQSSNKNTWKGTSLQKGGIFAHKLYVVGKGGGKKEIDWEDLIRQMPRLKEERERDGEGLGKEEGDERGNFMLNAPGKLCATASEKLQTQWPWKKCVKGASPKGVTFAEPPAATKPTSSSTSSSEEDEEDEEEEEDEADMYDDEKEFSSDRPTSAKALAIGHCPTRMYTTNRSQTPRESINIEGNKERDEERKTNSYKTDEAVSSLAHDWMVVRSRNSRVVNVFPRADDLVYADFQIQAQPQHQRSQPQAQPQSRQPQIEQDNQLVQEADETDEESDEDFFPEDDGFQGKEEGSPNKEPENVSMQPVKLYVTSSVPTTAHEYMPQEDDDVPMEGYKSETEENPNTAAEAPVATDQDNQADSSVLENQYNCVAEADEEGKPEVEATPQDGGDSDSGKQSECSCERKARRHTPRYEPLIFSNFDYEQQLLKEQQQQTGTSANE